MSKYTIKSVEPVYTGGNIWIFYGELTDGNYFLTDDYGATLILDSDPDDFDVSLYEDWQNEHLIENLEGDERLDFCNEMLDMIEKSEYKGLTKEEIDYYRNYMAELM